MTEHHPLTFRNLHIVKRLDSSNKEYSVLHTALFHGVIMPSWLRKIKVITFLTCEDLCRTDVCLKLRIQMCFDKLPQWHGKNFIR